MKVPGTSASERIRPTTAWKCDWFREVGMDRILNSVLSVVRFLRLWLGDIWISISRLQHYVGEYPFAFHWIFSDE